jgi:hypothetical protein
MATLGPQGRMTRPLTTPYNEGDRVVLRVNEEQADGRARVGDVGTIKQIIISGPNDGDQTFPMFYVKTPRGTVVLASREFALAAALYEWSNRFLKSLVNERKTTTSVERNDAGRN